MRTLGLIAVTLLLIAPVALVATFLLTPFWRWLEATTAIESIGHSGPANWCFGATYGLTMLAVIGIWYSLCKRARNR